MIRVGETIAERGDCTFN